MKLTVGHKNGTQSTNIHYAQIILKLLVTLVIRVGSFTFIKVSVKLD